MLITFCVIQSVYAAEKRVVKMNISEGNFESFKKHLSFKGAKMKLLRILLGIVFIFFINNMIVMAETAADQYAPKYYDEIVDMNDYYHTHAYRQAGKWGFYNDNGKMSSNIYSDYYGFNNKYIAVKQYNAWGLISREHGEMVLPVMWDGLAELPNDFVRIERNGKYGWTRVPGDYIFEPKYTHVDGLTGELLSVCDENGCGVLRFSEQVVIPLRHPYIFTRVTNGYFIVTDRNKYGIIDIFENTILECKYPEITKTDGNAAWIHEWDKYGLIRLKDGNTIAQPIYSKIEEIKDKPGYYKVKDKKWGIVDYSGLTIEPCKYGPLEINRVAGSVFPVSKIKEECKYNSYKFLLAEAYYKYMSNGIYGVDLKRVLRKLLSADNTYSDIRARTNDFFNNFHLDKNKL